MPYNKKTIIHTTSNITIKDNFIQPSESKTEEDTKTQLDLQQHECLNDKNKNDLIDKATKKARLITGESRNNKVGNDIPYNQKMAENQSHIDKNLQARKFTTCQTTTIAACQVVNFLPECKPNQELKPHQANTQKMPEDQIHIDSHNLQERNKTTSLSTTMAVHLVASFSPVDSPNEELNPHQTNIQTITEKTTNTKKYSWLMRTITRIINTPATRMRQHKCKFETNIKAATHKKKLLKHYKWDLEEALKRQRGTMMETASEFQEIEVLEH